MRAILPVLAVFVVVGLTGCAAEPPPAITATLIDPTDIRLDWRPAADGALGQVVEYRTQPTGRFITLAFLPANATTYTHRRLIPKTVFSYRVRAFFGAETPPVTPSGSAPAPPDPDWAAPRTAPATGHRSLRDSGPGGPTDLRATRAGTGVLLTWTDHADDEDAYLVEVTPANSATTRVAAVLPPHTDRVGIYPLPGERSASYRIAAIHYGPSTPTARQTTG